MAFCGIAIHSRLCLGGLQTRRESRRYRRVDARRSRKSIERIRAVELLAQAADFAFERRDDRTVLRTAAGCIVSRTILGYPCLFVKRGLSGVRGEVGPRI